eukprot:m.270344 g.270344  ORF g.270344 m.270344 type:complete len:62 (-) comp81410_c0_seq1:338-523(-)
MLQERNQAAKKPNRQCRGKQQQKHEKALKLFRSAGPSQTSNGREGCERRRKTLTCDKNKAE